MTRHWAGLLLKGFNATYFLKTRWALALVFKM